MMRWCWTGAHGAVTTRRLEREAAETEAAQQADKEEEEEPVYANVALVVGSDEMVGAAIVDMLEGSSTPAGPWKVYALSFCPRAWSAARVNRASRAAAASSSSSPSNSDGLSAPEYFLPKSVINIQANPAHPGSLTAALRNLTNITHVFYAAWSPRRGSTNAEATEANRAILRHVLSTVVPNCPALVHVCLQSGRDQFVDPFEPFTGITSGMRPYSEDLLRLEYPDLEDVLLIDLPRFVRRGAKVTWSAHRPATVFGFSWRSDRNVVASLCVYAAICRKEGAVLLWPGSRVAWEGYSDASDAELVAEQALWAALERIGKNQVFNCTNGDVFKWKDLWPRLARHFEVEWSGYDGEDKRFKLEEAMAGKEAVWATIIEEKKLVKTELGDVTDWWFVDAVINADKEQLDTMNKSKEHGFFGFRDTVRSFDTSIGKMKANRIVP